MKKIISVLLTIAIMAAFSSVAFAAEEVFTLGQTKTVTVEAGDTKEYTFTAPDDGVYILTLSVIDGVGAYADIIYDDCEVSSCMAASFLEEKLDGEAYFCGEKNEDFTIAVYGTGILWDDEIGELVFVDEAVEVEISISKMQTREIEFGKTYEVTSDYEVFTFIPEADGYYDFTSELKDGADPSIAINDIYGYIDENDDNGYEGDLNFDMNVYLQAGKVYGVECSNISFDEETEEAMGSFSFSVADGSNIKPAKLEFDERYYFVYENDYEFSFLYAVPTGAIVDLSTYVIEVEDESIATATYDAESDLIIIEGCSAGKTTITATDPETGVSTSALVVVAPMIVSDIFNVVSAISDIFYAYINAFLAIIELIWNNVVPILF